MVECSLGVHEVILQYFEVRARLPQPFDHALCPPRWRSGLEESQDKFRDAVHRGNNATYHPPVFVQHSQS